MEHAHKLPDKPIVIGKIRGVYGVRGWLRVHSFTYPPNNLFSYSPWWIEREPNFWHFLYPLRGRTQGNKLVTQVDKLTDRDEALVWVGKEIVVERSQFPDTADEYYWQDVIGCQVFNQSAELLGIVESMLETGAKDVMVIKGKVEYLIPFHLQQVVMEVDISRKKIVVNWYEDE